MDKENHLSVLDSHTPDALFKEYSSKEDCTADLIALFRNTPHSSLKKLEAVFLPMQNYNISALIEETYSSNRAIRYTATYMLLSKVKRIMKTKEEESIIDEICNTVFKIRIRDVDPHIRALALQFLNDWILCGPLFWKNEYLKYLGEGLSDRSDMVRRKSLRCINKLQSSKRKPEKHKSVLCRFLSEFKLGIIEMAFSEENALVRREARLVIYGMYSDNECIDESEIVSLLINDDFESKEKTKALQMLFPDGLYMLDRVHEICLLAWQINQNANISNIFKFMALHESSIASFVSAVISIAGKSSKCCSKESLCYLDVIQGLAPRISPDYFATILEVIKDNDLNIKKVLLALNNISFIVEYNDAIAKITNIIKQMLLDDGSSGTCLYIDEFVKFLHILSNTFPHIVNETVKDLAQKYPLAFIKSFDITNQIGSETNSLIKCYASLWFISSGEFQRVNSIKLTDHYNFLNLALFLEFFLSHTSKILGNTWDIGLITSENENVDSYDLVSSLLYMSRELYSLISRNFNFSDQDLGLVLSKLIEHGLFADKAHLVYENCSNDILLQILSKTKMADAFVSGYLTAVKNKRRLGELAKVVVCKLRKSSGRERCLNGVLFSWMKECISRKYLAENVLPYFVPALSVEESIFIESIAPKGKLKTACMRKIRGSAPVANASLI